MFIIHYTKEQRNFNRQDIVELHKNRILTAIETDAIIKRCIKKEKIAINNKCLMNPFAVQEKLNMEERTPSYFMEGLMPVIFSIITVFCL